MDWIIFFAINNMNYHVYKLESTDNIILKNIEKNNFNSIIILDGIITLVKIFQNKETLPLAILSRNHIISHRESHGAYYKITALKNTYLITLKEHILYYNKAKNFSKINIAKNYKKTLERYEETLQIIHQKNTTNRIILFILLIFAKFGLIKKHKIIVPVELRKEYIATMTGTSMYSVHRILKKINNIKIDKKNKTTIYLLRIEKL
uniref:Global nitrogen transcriptional regulator n=1 Tax=Vertebrata thuyoides TaxID=2006970 RepID=A0A1Z1MBS5_9FLOR|nr:global nitrogen transcriptional regulator [Vertebrata thuyoides]ARW63204.1 global nitrogen transcriptional regulator [Vertebrata thuyoides]